MEVSSVKRRRLAQLEEEIGSVEKYISSVERRRFAHLRGGN